VVQPVADVAGGIDTELDCSPVDWPECQRGPTADHQIFGLDRGQEHVVRERERVGRGERDADDLGVAGHAADGVQLGCCPRGAGDVQHVLSGTALLHHADPVVAGDRGRMDDSGIAAVRSTVVVGRHQVAAGVVKLQPRVESVDEDPLAVARGGGRQH